MANELPHRPLLAFLQRALAEFFRRTELQDVEIMRTVDAVPGRRAAAGQQRDAIRIDVEPVDGPSHERRPVQELEANLPRPRADQDGPAATDGLADTGDDMLT